MTIDRSDCGIVFYTDDTRRDLIGSIEQDSEGNHIYWNMDYAMTDDDLRIISHEIVNFVNRVIIRVES